MRLMHISDSHIGRAVPHVSRDRDFDVVLAEIVGIAEAGQPDLVVHSGDLFDSMRPMHLDLLRGVRWLQSLARVAPVVVLGGNHDSAILLQLLDLAANGLHTDDSPAANGRIRFVDQRRERGIVLDYPIVGCDERVRVASLPFVHINRTPRTGDMSYAAHLRDLQAELAVTLARGYRHDQDVLVFAAHLYLESALLSRTERPTEITPAYAVGLESSAPLAYAALGHIHQPQDIDRASFPARFAGSPLQLDFGEAGQEKSVTIVEATPQGRTNIHVIPLQTGRRLMSIEGSLAELATRADIVGNAILRVFVDIPVPDPHLSDRVSDLFPQAAIAQIYPRCEGTAVTVLSRDNTTHEDRSLPEIFLSYLATINTKGALADHALATFTRIHDDVTTFNEGPLPEEDLLIEALRHCQADGPLPSRASEDGRRA